MYKIDEILKLYGIQILKLSLYIKLYQLNENQEKNKIK